LNKKESRILCLGEASGGGGSKKIRNEKLFDSPLPSPKKVTLAMNEVGIVGKGEGEEGGGETGGEKGPKKTRSPNLSPILGGGGQSAPSIKCLANRSGTRH